MTLRVCDITELDHNAEFRNDVQISHFRTDANLSLLKSYMFTSGSFPGQKASAEVLRLLMDAAIESVENRFVVQATYGRGKSHFGLVAANYFGKPAESPEVKQILEKLEHTYNEPARVEPFRNFKKNRKPYLVLLLRGDSPKNLRDQFFLELENALQAMEATKGVFTPFWFGDALRFLNSLTAEQTRLANEHLSQHRLDLPSLRQKLERRETSTYSICVELFRKITDFSPNFGGETDLAEAIGWVVEDLCDKQDLIGGLLILFDEFSEFVRSYSSLHPIGVPLQELLNGVDNYRSKVLFVALAQHEPEKVVKNDGTLQYGALTKELTRLPLNKRFWLHSSLEDVLGAYFKPNHANWAKLLLEPGIGSRVASASELTLEVFAERYRRVMGWSPEEFQEKVTRECFPLHPLTTALLSSLDFERASNTRSVLGFLTDNEAPLRKILDEPAVRDGKPNWILPIELVDYFQEMLGEQVWQQFQQVDQPDLEPQQKAVLKAMLLQKAANIPTKSVGFENVIAELSGLSTKEAQATLKELEAQRYIRYDSANKIYAFWSGSNAAIELEKRLNQELAELQKRDLLKAYLDEFDGYGQNKVNKLVAEGKSPLSRNYPVSVDWGHNEDWAAQLVLLTRSSWTVQVLERLTARYAATLTDMPDCRGLVLLPLARTQDDLDWFNEHLRRVLDASAKLKAAPIVVVEPIRPAPELITNLQKYVLLTENTFVDKVVKEIGFTVIEEEKQRLTKQVLKTLDELLKDGSLEVPAEARGHVRALSVGVGATDRIERTLGEVYRIAYHKRPGEFFTQFRQTATNLRGAVEVLVPVLITNNLDGASVALSRVAKDIVDKFLASNAWGLINAKQKLQPPKADHPKKAWERLEGSIPPGKEWTPLKEVLLELLNVPYGYDHNTLALLFSAWLGYYRNDLQVAVGGKIVGLDSATGQGRKLKPKDFIELWASTSLRRKDRKQLLQDIETSITKVNSGGLGPDEATEILEKLKASANETDISDPALLDNARLALQKLNEGLQKLGEYERAVGDIEERLGRASNIQQLANLLSSIGGLTEPFTVASSKAKPPELRDRVLESIKKTTEDLCQVHERLDDIRQYGRQEEVLKNALRELNRLELVEPAKRVQQALKTLEREQHRLEESQKIDALLVKVNSLDASGSLTKLRKDLKELEPLVAHSSNEVREAAIAKKELLRAEVGRLEAFILGLEKQIDAIDSVEAAQLLERKLLRERNRFEGTPDIRDIESAEQRLRALINFFQRVEVDPPNTAEEAKSALLRLDGYLEEYKSHLSELQKQKLEKKSQSIREHIETQEKEASSWLESCRKRLAEGNNLAQLEAELARAHPFLPERLHSELDTLREQLKVLRAAELQEEITLKQIALTPTSGTLADLRRRKTELGSLPGSTRIVEAARQKLAELDQAIEELENQARAWESELPNLSSASQVQDLRDRINKALAKYENSEWYEKLEELSRRCREVADLLLRAEAQPTLHTPQEAQQRIAQLEEMIATTYLSDAQKNAVLSAITRVHDYVRKQEEKARNWLEDIEQQVSVGRPEALKHKLQQVPAFLPSSEQDRLQEIRAQVEKRLIQEQRDKELEQRLRTLTPVTTLRELREQQAVVGQWLEEATSTDLKQALIEKQRSLENGIRKLQEDLEKYRYDLGQARELTQVRKLLLEFKDLAGRFAGTDLATEATRLLDQADRLSDYFDNLRILRTSPLENPAQAHELLVGIQELNKQFGDLGALHLQAGQDLINYFEQQIANKELEAKRWLDQLRQKIEQNSQPELLEVELASPPSFLTNDGREELTRLRNLLKQRLDQNTRERIEQLFVRLSLSEREGCLMRLQELLQSELA
jgi:DNA repair exonuclease SbcCD ATPase subunit